MVYEMSRVAVVTGGASGMGEATCHELGRRGHKSPSSTSMSKRLNGSPKSCAPTARPRSLSGSMSPTARPSRMPSPRSAANWARCRSWSPVRGCSGSRRSSRSRRSRGNGIIDVNLTGTFHCCQAALPDMVEAGWGRIVMISSSSAQRGSPFAAHYAASKGAVITLTKSLAREYAPPASRSTTFRPRVSKRRCSTSPRPRAI